MFRFLKIDYIIYVQKFCRLNVEIKLTISLTLPNYRNKTKLIYLLFNSLID